MKNRLFWLLTAMLLCAIVVGVAKSRAQVSPLHNVRVAQVSPVDVPQTIPNGKVLGFSCPSAGGICYVLIEGE
jgi:hypothetical protein